MDELKKMNGAITIKDNFKQTSLSDEDLSLLRNLLDKQIIDVEGHKVVRVNDVTIQEKENNNPSYYISGVDIGFRGILRWLKLEDAALPLYRLTKWDSHPHFLSWTAVQPLELARGNVQLKKDWRIWRRSGLKIWLTIWRRRLSAMSIKLSAVWMKTMLPRLSVT